MIPKTDLEELERIVKEASDIGRRWSENRENFLIDEKSAGQFASNADIEIEQFVRGRLNETYPNQTIIGEEFGGELKRILSRLDVTRLMQDGSRRPNVNTC